jgi:hypothetical protein
MSESAYISLDQLFEDTTGDSGAEKPDKTGAQVRHCMVAVSKKLSGSDRAKARGSRNICHAHLRRSGYLKSGGRGEAVKSTGKGSRANMKHAMEKDNPKKQREYEKLAKAAR